MLRIEMIVRNSIKAHKQELSDKLCANYGTCEECPVSNVCKADTEEHNGFYDVIESIADYLLEEV